METASTLWYTQTNPHFNAEQSRTHARLTVASPIGTEVARVAATRERPDGVHALERLTALRSGAALIVVVATTTVELIAGITVTSVAE